MRIKGKVMDIRNKSRDDLILFSIQIEGEVEDKQDQFFNIFKNVDKEGLAVGDTVEADWDYDKSKQYRNLEPDTFKILDKAVEAPKKAGQQTLDSARRIDQLETIIKNQEKIIVLLEKISAKIASE